MEDPKSGFQDQTTMVSSVQPLSKLNASRKKITFYKYFAFIMSATLYAMSHATRTVWGYSKPYIKSEFYTSSLLGVLDFAFMFAYAIGQYLNGWLGDRVNLKLFLFLGMSGATTGLCLFGYLEGVLHLQNLFLAVSVFVLNGLGQSTGYPGCISIVSNWMTDAKAGIVFGIWGVNLNVGDIIGQQIGAIVIDYYGLPWVMEYALFITCSIMMFVVIVAVIFVKVHPTHLEEKAKTEGSNPLLKRVEVHAHHGEHHGHAQGIGFFEAWKIRHVPLFAFGYFCVKGVIYGVLFWLPAYLVEQVGFSGNISGLLASIEIGQIVGSVLFGFLSDRIKSRCIMISFGFFFAAIFLSLTYVINHLKLKALYFVLLFFAGMGLGGPTSLIGGAVSCDMGQQLAKTSKVSAISTIAGIMEGCGALGAALSQVFVSNFRAITFPFFAVLCFLGGILMVPVARDDYIRIKKERRRQAFLAATVAARDSVDRD